MDRRTFIKTTGAVGLGLGWGGSYSILEGKEAGMAFLTEKSEDRMLFPRPLDGISVNITPPGFAWLPAEGVAQYRVEIRRAGGDVVYKKEVGKDPVHLPNVILDAGAYEWDVVALDDAGKEAARRGVQRFSIPKGAPELPWVDPEELLSRVPEGHSRLLYPRAELDQVRATLETTRKRSWQACVRAADRALDTDAPQYPTYHKTEDDQTRRLEYVEYFRYIRGYIDRDLMNLSLVYLMTEEDKYADAAKRILLEIASWPTDDADVTSVSAKWGDEPGLSYSKCAHFAYDWLYHTLNDAEKKLVFQMCEDRAWQTYRRLTRMNYLTNPGSSHDGRLIAYLTDMAVSMAGESEGAKTWLDYSLKAMTTFYPHWAGYEGGWAEGAPYGLWYNGFYIPAFECLKQTTGFDLWQRPFFNNVRYFFFYCTSVRGEIRPFGDSAENGGPGARGGSGYADLMWHHAHRFDDPHVGWWVNQIQGWSGGSGRTSLLFDDDVPAKAPTDIPQSRAFRGVGWAGLHGDFADVDNDTFFLFKSSPYGSVSHSHADQNCFAIMKGGKALAIPSGYYGPSYGMAHHAEWTRSTKANNGVLVNGEGQIIRSAKANGHLVDFEDRKGLTYVSGDATAAYMGKLDKWVRHVLFLRPGLIVMLDDLKAPEAAQYQWMLHAFDKMALGDRQVISRREGKTMDVRLSCPQGLTLSQTDQFDTPYNEGIPEKFHKDMPNHWHVTAETETKAGATRIGAVLGIYGENEMFDIEVLNHEGWFGAKASGDFGEVTGWVQLVDGAEGPEGVGEGMVWGRDRDGEVFVK